jgi:hypothetical protein
MVSRFKEVNKVCKYKGKEGNTERGVPSKFSQVTGMHQVICKGVTDVETIAAARCV